MGDWRRRPAVPVCVCVGLEQLKCLCMEAADVIHKVTMMWCRPTSATKLPHIPPQPSCLPRSLTDGPPLWLLSVS